MKFTVSLKELSQALQKVTPALPKKSTLPVLEHFYFILEGDMLKVVASDQKITIMHQIVVNPSEDGKILVPGKRITDIIRALEESEEFTFASDDDTFGITIKTPFGKYSMKGLDPLEYLTLPELFQSEKPDITKIVNPIDEETKRKAALIAMKDITWASERTYFCVSVDDFKPAMTGVLFQFQGEKVNFVSTDGYRLTKATVFADEHNVFPDNLSVIIPARTVDLLRKADDDVLISFIEQNEKITHTRFDIGNTVIITRIIDESFPKYENVIPKENPYTLKVNKKEIVPALRRVSLFASSMQKLIKFDISSDSLTLIGEDAEAGTQAQEKIPCEFNNEHYLVGFNYELFLEAIQNIEMEDNEESVYIEMSGQTKPAVFKPKQDGEKLLMLLMPMKI
ncbi:MAG: DNA polymerase III subunit beta [Ignavibacteria bacterium]|nr:DNA polymerase III subunit beta [Ignavibacteria bacterium]